MTPIAEAILSGDSTVTITLAVALLGAVAAYVGEKVSTRYRLSALERSDEKMLEHVAAIGDRHQKDRTECLERFSRIELELDRMKRSPAASRTGSYPTLGADER